MKNDNWMEYHQEAQKKITGVTINYEDGTKIELLDDMAGNGEFLKRKLNSDGVAMNERRVSRLRANTYIQKFKLNY